MQVQTVFDGKGFGYQPRAPFACDPADSRGRLYPQTESRTRTAFQRDRDRIIHSTAFRRLKHKTQVFISHEGDHYRTRLTHTIEVAQIARSIARAFRLDEDLAEAVALVHDFGHTPFGHAGERILDGLMKPWGGFDHNAQSLRIVTRLEHRYAEFDGLNLTWETLEGLVKHNGPLCDRSGKGLKGDIPKPVLDFNELIELDLDKHASLEAQAAAIADDIAYDAHDIDDGLRAGLLDFDELRSLPLVGPIISEIDRLYPHLDRARMIGELGRRQITAMVEDVIEETSQRLQALKPAHCDEVRNAGQTLVGFSPEMAKAETAIKKHLYARLYRHPVVMGKMNAAGEIVDALFKRYMADAEALPESWRHGEGRLHVASGGFAKLPDGIRARTVCDFLSGMTDQFAMREYERLFDRPADLG